MSTLLSICDFFVFQGDNDEVDRVPQKVALTKNLFIIGTINVDETTYMFSPKVLDRANVIEFKIAEKEMAEFLEDMKEKTVRVLTVRRPAWERILWRKHVGKTWRKMKKP